MPVFDDFIPEEWEAQNRDLTALLEQLYQQPAIVEEPLSQAEQKHILVEVRATLLTAKSIMKQSETTAPPMVLLANKELIQLPEHVASKRRLSPVARLFNAIAAVLFVAILIAGSLVLFTALRNTTPGTKTPLITVPSCLPANTIQGVGLDYLCTQHLSQNLDLVQGNGQYRVTLTKGYADQGQVLVWYQVEKKVNGQYQILKPSTVGLGSGSFALSAPDSKALGIHLSQPLAQPGVIGWIFSPNTPLKNVEAAKTIQVQMHLTSIAQYYDMKDIKNIPMSLSFQFNLNAHGSWHSVSLQQTQVANGHSLTLKSMSYSLSMVDIALKSPEPWFSGTYNAPTIPYEWPIVTSLKVGNVECILNPQSRFYQGAKGEGPYMGLEVRGPNGEFWQNINCSLPGEGIAPSSEVTLVLSMYSTEATNKNTSLPPSAIWTFRFPLP
jgi:hypothetical protein